jgi:hypothetical protein
MCCQESKQASNYPEGVPLTKLATFAIASQLKATCRQCCNARSG